MGQIDDLAQEHFGAGAPNLEQDVDAMAKAFFKKIPSEGSLAGQLAETQGEEPFEPSKGLAEMQKCLSQHDGIFCMHGGIIGNQWADWIRNPQNKAKYQAVGKKYADQRTFRARWLAKVTSQLEKHEMQAWLTQSTRASEDDRFVGTYKTFSKSWKDDGGTPAAFSSTMNMWKSAAVKFAQGVRWRNRPYLKFHPEKKVVQCLDLEEVATSAHTETHATKKRFREVDDVDGGDEGGEVVVAGGARAAGEEEKTVAQSNTRKGERRRRKDNE